MGARPDGEASILLLDLDNFKQINDTYGHPAGDAVIPATADALRHAARETDLLARLGGEEFVVVMPGLPGDKALEVAQRLVAAVRASSPQADAPGLKVTASAGLASWIPGDDLLDTFALAVAVADRHLYAAKEAGKDRICC